MEEGIYKLVQNNLFATREISAALRSSHIASNYTAKKLQLYAALAGIHVTRAVL